MTSCHQQSHPEPHDEWEYEYDENETEDFYFTLDLTTHVQPLARRNPPPPVTTRRRPGRQSKNQPKRGDNDLDDGEDFNHEDDDGVDDAHSPSPAINRKPNSEPAPARAPDGSHFYPSTQDKMVPSISSSSKLERLQVLDIASEEPLISDGHTVYACRWTESVGTDMLYALPPATLGSEEVTVNAKYEHENPKPRLIAATSARLIAHPLELEPREDYIMKQTTDTSNTPIASESRTNNAAQTQLTAQHDYKRQSFADQRSFLSRFQAIKTARGETDTVPLHYNEVFPARDSQLQPIQEDEANASGETAMPAGQTEPGSPDMDSDDDDLSDSTHDEESNSIRYTLPKSPYAHLYKAEIQAPPQSQSQSHPNPKQPAPLAHPLAPNPSSPTIAFSPHPTSPPTSSATGFVFDPNAKIRGNGNARGYPRGRRRKTPYQPVGLERLGWETRRRKRENLDRDRDQEAGDPGDHVDDDDDDNDSSAMPPPPIPGSSTISANPDPNAQAGAESEILNSNPTSTTTPTSTPNKRPKRHFVPTKPNTIGAASMNGLGTGRPFRDVSQYWPRRRGGPSRSLLLGGVGGGGGGDTSLPSPGSPSKAFEVVGATTRTENRRAEVDGASESFNPEAEAEAEVDPLEAGGDDDDDDSDDLQEPSVEASTTTTPRTPNNHHHHHQPEYSTTPTPSSTPASTKTKPATLPPRARKTPTKAERRIAERATRSATGRPRGRPRGKASWDAFEAARAARGGGGGGGRRLVEGEEGGDERFVVEGAGGGEMVKGEGKREEMSRAKALTQGGVGGLGEGEGEGEVGLHDASSPPSPAPPSAPPTHTTPTHTTPPQTTPTHTTPPHTTPTITASATTAPATTAPATTAPGDNADAHNGRRADAFKPADG